MRYDIDGSGRIFCQVSVDIVVTFVDIITGARPFRSHLLQNGFYCFFQKLRRLLWFRSLLALLDKSRLLQLSRHCGYISLSVSFQYFPRGHHA
jgi:hypothetical protein